MWIFLNNAFVSIVADRENSSRLLVRARFGGDIQRAFGQDVTERETPHADYRFRAFLDRERVGATLQAQIMAIDYPNFKASVEDHARHDVYLDVWDVMHRAQEQQAG